jgi:AraC-like DNA-binding protein
MNLQLSHIWFNVVRGMETEALRDLREKTRDTLTRDEVNLEIQRRNHTVAHQYETAHRNAEQRLIDQIIHVLERHHGQGLAADRIAERVMKSARWVRPFLNELLEDGRIEYGMQHTDGTRTFKIVRNNS